MNLDHSKLVINLYKIINGQNTAFYLGGNN